MGCVDARLQDNCDPIEPVNWLRLESDSWLFVFLHATRRFDILLHMNYIHRITPKVTCRPSSSASEFRYTRSSYQYQTSPGVSCFIGNLRCLPRRLLLRFATRGQVINTKPCSPEDSCFMVNKRCLSRRLLPWKQLRLSFPLRYFVIVLAIEAREAMEASVWVRIYMTIQLLADDKQDYHRLWGGGRKGKEQGCSS